MKKYSEKYFEVTLKKIGDDLFNNEPGETEWNFGSKESFLAVFFKVIDKIGFQIKDASVLDIGCHRCAQLLVFKKHGVNDLEGIDIEPCEKAMWLKEPKNFDIYWGNEPGKIKFHVFDVDQENLSYDTNSKSIIIFNQVIEHLHNPFRVMSEISRVLKPGGLVMIGTPNVANLKNRILLLFGKSNYWSLENFLKFRDSTQKFNGHIREYTMEELEEFCKMYGLKIIDKSFIASQIKSNFPKSKIIYKIYRFVEKLVPRFRFQLCVIAQKSK